MLPLATAPAAGLYPVMNPLHGSLYYICSSAGTPSRGRGVDHHGKNIFYRAPFFHSNVIQGKF